MEDKNSQDSYTLVKRGRGRPKGSKNKPKTEGIVLSFNPGGLKRGRGRPKGSKNKPKDIVVEDRKYKPREDSEELHPAETKVRRRKSLVESNTTAQPVEVEHVLYQAAKWLERNMSPIEVEHYRRRANRSTTTLHQAMVSDILGIFNIRDPEICKQFKKQTL